MYSDQVNCKYQVVDNHVVIVDYINKYSLYSLFEVKLISY